MKKQRTFLIGLLVFVLTVFIGFEVLTSGTKTVRKPKFNTHIAKPLIHGSTIAKQKKHEPNSHARNVVPQKHIYSYKPEIKLVAKPIYKAPAHVVALSYLPRLFLQGFAGSTILGQIDILAPILQSNISNLFLYAEGRFGTNNRKRSIKHIFS